MGSVNKVILVGNVGADPEVRRTQGGTTVANFRLACNEKWRDRDGNMQERVEWVRVVVWGKTAEIVEQYLRRGKEVYVEGKLQTREWEDKDGAKRYTTEVNAQHVVFIGRKGQEDDGGSRQDSRKQSRSTSPPAPPEGDGYFSEPPDGISDDYIPF